MALVQHQRNEQALQQAQIQDQEKQTAANGPFILNPRAGKTSFRVLPPWDERGLWYHEVREHGFINGNPRATFVCTEENQGRCPICEHGAALAAQNLEEEAKKFKASTKYLLNVIVYSDPTGKNSPKNGVMVMKVGTTVKRSLLSYDLAVSEGYGDITALQTGFDLTLERTGTGFGTKYDVKVFPQRRDVLQRLVEEGMDPSALSLHPLDQVMVELPVDQLAEEFANVMAGAATPQAQPVPVAQPVAVAPAAKLAVAPAVNATPLTGFKPVAAPTVSGIKIAAPPTVRK